MNALKRHLDLHHAHTAHTQGLVMDMGWRYDLMVWALDSFVLRGAIRNLRRTTLDTARLAPGDNALDVGCGTGTLALEAARRVGPQGRVVGIDPGARQVARACAKAAQQHLGATFQVATIEQLPFPDHSFDVVLSTMMMHHLPDPLKQQGLAEIARVIKPAGRLVIVDMKRPEQPGEQRQFGAGALGIQDLPELLRQAGFGQVESGDLPFPRLMGLAGAGWIKATY